MALHTQLPIYRTGLELLHDSPQWLNAARADIERKLAALHLQLNPRKTILQPVARGVDFVGHLIQPWRRTTRPRTLATALRRIADMPDADTYAAGNSYLGLVRQATHSHKERAALCRALMKRGHAIEGMHLSQVFRKKGAPQ